MINISFVPNQARIINPQALYKLFWGLFKRKREERTREEKKKKRNSLKSNYNPPYPYKIYNTIKAKEFKSV